MKFVAGYVLGVATILASIRALQELLGTAGEWEINLLDDDLTDEQ